MTIARNLVKLWSWELDQTDPYIVLELFRWVPRPKTDFLEKCFSGQNIGFSEFYRFYRLYRLCRFYRLYRVWRLYRLYRFYRFYRFKTPPTFTPHTKGTRDSTDGGGAFGAAPIGSIIFPLCVVWMLSLFCVARVCSLLWLLCAGSVFFDFEIWSLM